ncbi:MAG: hypothetical protein H6522_05650 [Mycolicibacterium sp.]|nr:hypothetical protein [Mycobacterium sp.]MCB9416675.1 hypothetical protein [Mycolicibacterium sp.]TXI48382.1 MAG: hypothetical protein E6Q57_08225 [Mycobacterium sp.]HNF05234.1 hypothetical protein [Mycobacterium sp.]
MNNYFAALLTALATAVLPVALGIASAPAAHADTCEGPGCVDLGPLVEVGNDVEVGAAVFADAADAVAQAASGRPPCYTPAGVPYYTPGDSPC